MHLQDRVARQAHRQLCDHSLASGATSLQPGPSSDALRRPGLRQCVHCDWCPPVGTCVISCPHRTRRAPFADKPNDAWSGHLSAPSKALMQQHALGIALTPLQSVSGSRSSSRQEGSVRAARHPMPTAHHPPPNSPAPYHLRQDITKFRCLMFCHVEEGVNIDALLKALKVGPYGFVVFKGCTRQPTPNRTPFSHTLTAPPAFFAALV